MNVLDTTSPSGRELVGILADASRRSGLLKAQAGMGSIRLPSMSAARRGFARQARLDELRAVALEPIGAWR